MAIKVGIVSTGAGMDHAQTPGRLGPDPGIRIFERFNDS